MKILLTGASGFVGAQVLALLRSRGYSVITTDKCGEVDLVGDLTDTSFVARLPEVDHVIYLASVQYVTRHKPLFGFKQWFFENNVVATKNLAEKYIQTHFVYMATSMVFAQHEGAIYRSSSARGTSGLYGQSKLEAVQLVEKLDSFAIVYPCIIIGPGREGLFRPLIACLRRFRIMLVTGTEKDRISVVDVRDVANIVAEIVKQRFQGHVTVAGTGDSSVASWGVLAANALGLKRVIKMRIPVWAITSFAAITLHRFVFPEQVGMFRFGHHVWSEAEVKLGVEMQYSCSDSIDQMVGRR